VSSLRDEAFFPAPADAVMQAARRAVAEFGWRYKVLNRRSFVCRERFSMGWTWPVRIRVTVGFDGTGTGVLMTGWIFGVGPLPSHHLHIQLERLVHRIGELTRESSERFAEGPVQIRGGFSAAHSMIWGAPASFREERRRARGHKDRPPTEERGRIPQRAS
jgi:hypothetical protein